MVRRFRPTWTQADYQKVKKHYHRHRMMTKVVDSVLASGVSYTDIAKRAGIAQATITRWVTGTTKNARIDTIMSVLEALNTEMVLVTRKEAHDNASKEKVTHVRIKSVTAS
jgi:transcriptional regulator with XRE-family HTH domain